MPTWKPLGHCFVASGQYGWMQTHASYPTVEALGGSLVRVYFACRDADNRSSTGYVDIDITKPRTIQALSSTPVLTPGPRGSFDDSGALPTSFIKTPQGDYLYYMGWVVGKTVFARNSIGVAIRKPGAGSFEKYSPAPVLDRHAFDPLNITYGCVLPHPEGGYRMWYNSNLTWGSGDNDMQHVMKYARSDDGIHWQRDGRVVMGLMHPNEMAVSRPTVMADKDMLRMWYCWRGERYLLGYATSDDGLDWRRDDLHAGLEPEPDGWEQGSIHYPCVFDHAGQRYMFYNGGRYGSSGFGLAVLEKA